MKEAIVAKNGKVTIIDSPIPKPSPGQVLIKVAFSGSNPKDWKVPLWMDLEHNSGDDIAGIVQEVGEGVSEFRPGDRVMAFHEMREKHGSFAEFAVAWSHTTARLPDKTSFEEAAAIPLAALTAVVGLYDRLRLPPPWLPAKTKIPLVVYGGGTAVGTYVLQLARHANIHPLIAVGGRARSHVESFLDTSRGDAFVDYRGGEDTVVDGIRAALNGEKLYYAYDAVSESGSDDALARVIEPDGGAVTFVLPAPKLKELPDSINKSLTMVGDVHTTLKDLGYVGFRYLVRGLDEGWFKGQPQEVVPGGLEGVESALQNLRDGKASATKYIFKIGDTTGAGQ